MECDTIERYDVNDLSPIRKPKRKFETLEADIQIAKKINSAPHIIHKVVAYKCTKCHKFHMGRNGSEVTEKERARWIKSF